jgi:hypothetical protein
MTASAFDANGQPLQSVKFYADGQLISQVTPGNASSAASHTGPTRADALSSGLYQIYLQVTDGAETLITATATNAQGVTTVFQAIPVRAAAPVSGLLSCVITSPSDNSQYPAGQAVNVTVTALESGGSVAKVDFYVNDKLVSSAYAPPFNFTLPSSSVGVYTLSAIATDANRHQHDFRDGDGQPH